MDQQFSPFSQALIDYAEGNTAHSLILHNSYGEPEEMSIEVFFREAVDLSPLEKLVIESCSGEILDIGAGAGALSVILQQKNQQVTALENDQGCVELMKAMGIQSGVEGDLWHYEAQYDTVLVMMNGLGLAGKLDRVPGFLKKCMSLLAPSGQLLFDSSDISYLFEDETAKKTEGYFGEVQYKYEYRNKSGDWFDWVYVDQNTLKGICSELSLKLEILHTNEYDQYLARVEKHKGTSTNSDLQSLLHG